MIKTLSNEKANLSHGVIDAIKAAVGQKYNKRLYTLTLLSEETTLVEFEGRRFVSLDISIKYRSEVAEYLSFSISHKGLKIPEQEFTCKILINRYWLNAIGTWCSSSPFGASSWIIYSDNPKEILEAFGQSDPSDIDLLFMHCRLCIQHTPNLIFNNKVDFYLHALEPYSLKDAFYRWEMPRRMALR